MSQLAILEVAELSCGNGRIPRGVLDRIEYLPQIKCGPGIAGFRKGPDWSRKMSPNTTAIVYCPGPMHRKSGERRQIDMQAKGGRHAPGLIEDGSVFCKDCADGLASVSDDIRPFARFV